MVLDNKEWQKDETQKRFSDDMADSYFEVEEYRGRGFYHGWAVRCSADDLQDVIRATEVKLQWDQMGLGYVVYPK